MGLFVLADWDHMDMDWGAGGWIVMAVGMALFWGLLILGVIWLVRTFSAPAGHHLAHTGPSALELLDRSLAEGKLDIDEYEKRRRILGGSPPSDG